MALTKIPGSLLDTASGINGLIYPTSDGTAGQFLKTDGSGNLTFATVTTYTDSDVETYLDGGTSTPTFASATVSGALTVTGDLNITGDINSYNVTDLDVTDQTITLGAGQIEANSGGSGIIVDGSGASILWDETNTEWDFNKNVNFAGNIIASDVKAAGAGGLSLQTDEGTKRIFIKDNGDVKVGQLAVGSATTAPLHVAKSSTDCQAIFGDNNSSIDDPSIRIIGRDTANSAIRYTFVGLDADTNYGYIGYNAGSGGFVNALSFNTSGHVGIGTSNPQMGLHVGSGTQAIAALSGIGIANGGSSYSFYSASDGTKQYIAGIDHNITYTKAGSLSNHSHAIITNNTNAIFIDTSQNVGIGTDSPNALLHIKTADPATNQAVIDFRNPTYGIFAQTNSISTRGNTLEFIASDYNNNSATTHNVLTLRPEGNVGIGTSTPKSSLQIEGGRMGIISTSSSWEQLRVANSSVAEAGIAIMNGCTASEFLADDGPSFSNAFTLAINPYGCGTDTLAVAHGNLGDSIWHIDGSGNFGYGPGTDNPVSYYEISKTRPNVNQPSDYELKMTLNTYGYVGSGYKLALLQWLGGDTAGAQDNFYAGIGSTALDGVNNSEEGSLDFYVRNGADSNHLAVQIIGKAGAPLAGGGQVAKSTLFRYQGIAIDRVWAGYPGISVLNSSDAGSSLQGEFRFHGTNSTSAAYPTASGADFSVDVRADGSFISSSDGRSKTNITTIDNALSKVNQLTGKRFQRINRENQPQEHLSKNGYKFGFIAQDVEDIIPEAVKHHADEDDGTENWNSAYAMDYGSVVALLVNAIKEQDVVIQDLKARIETLEG